MESSDHHEEWNKPKRWKGYERQLSLFQQELAKRILDLLETELVNADIEHQLDAVLARFNITRPGADNGRA